MFGVQPLPFHCSRFTDIANIKGTTVTPFHPCLGGKHSLSRNYTGAPFAEFKGEVREEREGKGLRVLGFAMMTSHLKQGQLFTL